MRSVELFAGAGGLGLGLCAAGFKPRLVVEWNAASCRTLRHNKEQGIQYVRDWNIVQSDAREVNYASIAGDVDLVSGGPPCQPFSLGGKHRGQADDRNMWPEAVRAVRELAPKAFLFENVRGIMRPAFATYLRYIGMQLTFPEISKTNAESWEEHLARLDTSRLQKDGLSYNVYLHALDAADYGAAQRRRRVILVGLRSDLEIEWIAPVASHSREALIYSQWVTGDYWDRHQIALKDRPPIPESLVPILKRLNSDLFTPSTAPWRTVRDVICDLPEPIGMNGDFHNHRFQPGARSYPGHTGSPFDSPAKALKAGDHGVPGGENMLARIDGAVRYFTVREAARLQGFPDDFIFPPTVAWSECMRQLGNAVPTQLSRTFGSAVSDALNMARKIKLKQAA